MAPTHEKNPAKKDRKNTKWEGSDKLLSNREYQKQLCGLPWMQELNDLGMHWYPKESENDPRWQAQVDQACALAYIALRANGPKYFDHRTDDDDIVLKAWELLKADIESYDPRKSPLGVWISKKLKNRIVDAIDFYTRQRDHEAWADELSRFQTIYPNDPVLCKEWLEAIVQKAFHFYSKRIDAVATTPEIRAAIREALRSTLTQFDPAEQSLHKLVDRWVSQVLHGDQKDVITIPIDKPVGEDEESTIGDMLPGIGNDPAEIVEATGGFSIILLALTANFQLHVGNGHHKAKTRYSRLNYTEQLSYFAGPLSLPDSHRQDILKPLDESYFRHFMDVGPETPLTLRVIENARIRPVIGKGVYRLENKHWDDEGFLPAKVQIGYLAENGISSSAATVSEHRKSYRENFLKYLEGLR